MSGIAYLIRNWRILQLVLFTPMVLVLGIFYWSAASHATFSPSFLRLLSQKIKVYILVCDHISSRILPESARWLITQGKKKEAIKEICRAAKVNGRKVPGDLLDRVSSL